MSYGLKNVISNNVFKSVNFDKYFENNPLLGIFLYNPMGWGKSSSPFHINVLECRRIWKHLHSPPQALELWLLGSQLQHLLLVLPFSWLLLPHTMASITWPCLRQQRPDFSRQPHFFAVGNGWTPFFDRFIDDDNKGKDLS